MSDQTPRRFDKPLLWLLAWVFTLASSASGTWKEKDLYSFQNIPDGAEPVGALAFDKTGNLYGATSWGGADNCPGVAQCGIVYQVQPPARKGDSWTENILYTFEGKDSNDGETPAGGVMFDDAGNLYGTTGYGGAGGCLLGGGLVGCGTVYELSPPQQKGGRWTETILYSFQGNTDGYFPSGDLIFDKQGNIYGATQFGGGFGSCNPFYGFCGTVFELVKPTTKDGAWAERVLYSFRGTNSGTFGDGANPNGGLIFDSNGAIYGTTFAGGNNAPICGNTPPLGCGTVFELVPPKQDGGAWTEKIIHVFGGPPTDGAAPYSGLAFDKRGNLYSTTAGGGKELGGVVFELSPPRQQGGAWRESFPHVFNLRGLSDGTSPMAQPIFDASGNLYGTALGGTSPNGVVFRLTPEKKGKEWSFTLLYNFQGSPDGRWPVSRLLFDKAGKVYSSTQDGGTNTTCQGGCGTVFQLSR